MNAASTYPVLGQLAYRLDPHIVYLHTHLRTRDGSWRASFLGLGSKNTSAHSFSSCPNGKSRGSTSQGAVRLSSTLSL